MRKIKDHNRCFGSESCGASIFIFSQTRQHNCGVIPKNDLKRRRRVFWLSFAFVFVYLLPVFKNVLEVTTGSENEPRFN